MGHFHSGSDSQIVQSVSAFPNTDITGGIFTSPVYWNGHVYVAGIGGSVQDFALTAGKLSTSPSSQTSAHVAPHGRQRARRFTKVALVAVCLCIAAVVLWQSISWCI